MESDASERSGDFRFRIDMDESDETIPMIFGNGSFHLIGENLTLVPVQYSEGVIKASTFGQSVKDDRHRKT